MKIMTHALCIADPGEVQSIVADGEPKSPMAWKTQTLGVGNIIVLQQLLTGLPADRLKQIEIPAIRDQRTRVYELPKEFLISIASLSNKWLDELARRWFELEGWRLEEPPQGRGQGLWLSG